MGHPARVRLAPSTGRLGMTNPALIASWTAPLALFLASSLARCQAEFRFA